MTIAYDASSRASSDGTTALTIAHTCSGTNRALVVSAECPNSTDYLATATVTYAGVSMGAARVSETGAGSLFMYSWVLANPASGTNNIVVTPSGGAYLDVIGTSFTGVDQTTPVDATAAYNNAYGVSPISTAIAVSAGGVAVDAFAERALSGTLVPDASQTLSGAVTSNSVSRMGASYKASATAMSWTFSASQPIVATTIVSLKSAAGGAGAVIAAATSATPSSSAILTTYTPAITIPAIKNLTTGTLRTGETGITVIVNDLATGALVVKKTAQTTDGSGNCVVSDPALTAATTYRVTTILADESEGTWKYAAA